MEQIVKRISTYSADWAGVCSALYELGGMIVIHDASGCNSTYTTFDEPRWYQMDSMFFISGLTEIDAVLGNEEKLMDDIINAANSLHPAFIAIVGSPIPSMIGTDFEGIAKQIERKSGIPSFGFATNGMNYYCQGGAMAFVALAKRFCVESAHVNEEKHTCSINILGVTPLDFSIQGNVEAMRASFEKNGIKVESVWAMGSTLNEIRQAVNADVNVVVSTMGIKAARYLKETFHIPYVVGVPIGDKALNQLCDLIKTADTTKENQYLITKSNSPNSKEKILVIGEQILSLGICYCLKEEFEFSHIDMICPLKTNQLMYDIPDEMREGITFLSDEKEIAKRILDYSMIVADPMYQPIVPAGIQLIAVPHEAFSSRIYRKQAPVLIGDAFRVFIHDNIKKKQVTNDIYQE